MANFLAFLVRTRESRSAWPGGLFQGTGALFTCVGVLGDEGDGEVRRRRRIRRWKKRRRWWKRREMVEQEEIVAEEQTVEEEKETVEEEEETVEEEEDGERGKRW